MIETLDIETEWSDVKSRLVVGSIVEGTVIAHLQFGIFLELNEAFVGLIQITHFREAGERMTAREYPEMGANVRAVVIDFRDSNHQIALSARPSDLAKAGA